MNKPKLNLKDADQKELSKVFTTKYCLRNGKIGVELVEISPEHGLAFTQNHLDMFRVSEYAFTEQEAKSQAEQKRLKKIASLQRQIAKLEKLKF